MHTYGCQGPQPPSTGFNAFRSLGTHFPCWHQFLLFQHCVPSAHGMCCVRQPSFSPGPVVHHNLWHTGWKHLIQTERTVGARDDISTTHHIGTYFRSRSINQLALFVFRVVFAGQVFFGWLIFDFQIIFTRVVLKTFTVTGSWKPNCIIKTYHVYFRFQTFKTYSKYSVKKCRLQIDQVHGWELWPNILDMTWLISSCLPKSLHLASSSCGILNLEIVRYC